PRQGVRDAGEWRVLRLPPADLRLDERGGGAGPGAVPAAGQGRKAAQLQLRRLLGLHGHLQGEAAARGSLHPRSGAVGGVEGERRALGARPQERLTMHRLSLFSEGQGVRKILALGAHADDIEIGCGGTLLRLLSERSDLEVTWVVFCSTPERAREAEASAQRFLERASRRQVIAKSHRDGFLPTEQARVKEEFEELKAQVSPDLILTHFRDDRHQDHRVVSELTWNTWRNHA